MKLRPGRRSASRSGRGGRAWRTVSTSGLRTGLIVAVVVVLVATLAMRRPETKESSRLSSSDFEGETAGNGPGAATGGGTGGPGGPDGTAAGGATGAGGPGGGGAVSTGRGSAGGGSAGGGARQRADGVTGAAGRGGSQVGEDDAGEGGAGGDAGGAGGPCTAFPGCGGAQGVTDTTIKLGFPVAIGAEEALRAVGGPTVNFGDGKAQVNALVKDLNERGGIVGRKIEPVFVELAAASPDPEGDTRRACTTFTEDQRVFAVLSIEISEEFSQCLANHRTLGLGAFGQPGDDQFLQKDVFPWSQHPSLKGETRLFKTMLPTLDKRGFFAKNREGEPVEAKVGLVVLDEPSYRRTSDRIVKPFLGDKGIGHVEFRYTASTLADLQAQMVSGVQKFKSERVTHVLFLPGFGSAFLFMPAAEEAEFFPRYAVDSNMVPGIALKQAPPRQLVASMGIGWMPGADMGNAYPLSSQEQRCIAVMNKGFGTQRKDRAGRPDPIDGRDEELTKTNYCDVVWAFEAAGVKAGRRLTSGSWVAGLQSLGTSWPSAITFQSDFSRGTVDASWKHRLLAYRSGCDCFEYETGDLDDVG